MKINLARTRTLPLGLLVSSTKPRGESCKVLANLQGSAWAARTGLLLQLVVDHPQGVRSAYAAVFIARPACIGSASSPTCPAVEHNPRPFFFSKPTLKPSLEGLSQADS